MFLHRFFSFLTVRNDQKALAEQEKRFSDSKECWRSKKSCGKTSPAFFLAFRLSEMAKKLWGSFPTAGNGFF